MLLPTILVDGPRSGARCRSLLDSAWTGLGCRLGQGHHRLVPDISPIDLGWAALPPSDAGSEKCDVAQHLVLLADGCHIDRRIIHDGCQSYAHGMQNSIDTYQTPKRLWPECAIPCLRASCPGSRRIVMDQEFPVGEVRQPFIAQGAGAEGGILLQEHHFELRGQFPQATGYRGAAPAAADDDLPPGLRRRQKRRSCPGKQGGSHRGSEEAPTGEWAGSFHASMSAQTFLAQPNATLPSSSLRAADTPPAPLTGCTTLVVGSYWCTEETWMAFAASTKL